MLVKALHFISDYFSVGNMLQNIAFYSLLLLMIWVIIVQLKMRPYKVSKRIKNT